MVARRKLRLQEIRRRKRYALCALGLVVFVAAFSGLVFLLRLPEVTINSVAVSETEYVRNELVLEMVNGMLEGNYLLVIPRSNTFLYPKHAIQRDMFALFPSVERVKFSRIGFNTLSISITERTPVAEWCSNPGTSSPCYLLDNGGFVFAPQRVQGSSFVVYGGGLTGDPLGQTYLSGEFQSIQEFVQDLKKVTERNPKTVLIDEHDDVSVTFKEGGELRFAVESANGTLLDNIASVFASRRFHSDDILEYADFRFGNKIYVKFEDK